MAPRGQQDVTISCIKSLKPIDYMIDLQTENCNVADTINMLPMLDGRRSNDQDESIVCLDSQLDSHLFLCKDSQDIADADANGGASEPKAHALAPAKDGAFKGPEGGRSAERSSINREPDGINANGLDAQLSKKKK